MEGRDKTWIRRPHSVVSRGEVMPVIGQRQRRTPKDEKNREKKNHENGGPILIPGDDYDIYLETLSPTKAPTDTPTIPSPSTPSPVDVDEDPPTPSPTPDSTVTTTPGPDTSSPAPVITPTPNPIATNAPITSPSPPDNTPGNPTTQPVAATPLPVSAPTAAPSSSIPTPGPNENADTSFVVDETKATCTNLVSSSTQTFDFRYWIDLASTNGAPTDVDREMTVLQLEEALLDQMAGTLLACENEDNQDLGIVSLDYAPLDTLSERQEECPSDLQNCFVYDGVMGLSIEADMDMDMAIEAARTTIQVIMEANNDFFVLGVNGLNDVEYLGPPFTDTTDAAIGSSQPTTLSGSSGNGLSAAGIFLIAFSGFAAAIAMIIGLSRRHQKDGEGEEEVETKLVGDEIGDNRGDAGTVATPEMTTPEIARNDSANTDASPEETPVEPPPEIPPLDHGAPTKSSRSLLAGNLT